MGVFSVASCVISFFAVQGNSVLEGARIKAKGMGYSNYLIQ